jgi:hypothetical protein
LEDVVAVESKGREIRGHGGFAFLFQLQRWFWW